MQKYHFIVLLVSFLVIPSTFASSIDWESDNGDYIGQGKSVTFNTSQGDNITVQGASPNSVTFQFSSFNISGMSLGLSSANGKTLSEKGKFYPAKRNAFRDGYNGIDLSGDGRGCNTILGGFYVHEYNEDNGVLQSAAIDFVQYCEGNTSKGLYGSIRYNSTIPSSCSKGKCQKVKDLFGITSISTTSLSQNQTSINQKDTNKELENKLYTYSDNSNALWEKLSNEFPLFFENCDYTTLDINDAMKFENACGDNYKSDLKKAKIALLAKKLIINKTAVGKSGDARIKAMLTAIDAVLKDLRKERAKIRPFDKHKNIQTAATIISLESIKLAGNFILELKK